jgi:hypothetical protein
LTSPVGPRGLTVLVIVGLVGVALAIIGWSQRGTGLVAPSVGGLGGSAPTRTPTASPATPTGRASATSSASATPSATATSSATPSATATSSATPSATASAGPPLSSEPYASFAYLVWPGSLSTPAQQAMSGLTIQVTRQTGGISVRAGVTGQPLPSAQFYSGGGKVYVIESNLGDDSGDVDYNLGDDALVVTNLRGQVVS